MSFVVVAALLGFAGWALDRGSRSDFTTRAHAAARAAGALQPCAPRWRAWVRLPLLPHHGGESGFANIPPTKTCMNCHSQIWSTSPTLEPVRASFRENQSIRWTRVHDLPDFVYFNHSIHVNKGVGCETCHGRVDKMPLTWQENSLQMEWCLDCHRNPEKYVTAAGIHHEDGLSSRRAIKWRSAASCKHEYKIQRRADFDELFYLPPMSDSPQKLDLAAVRERLEGARGRDYWRSLDELSAHARIQGHAWSASFRGRPSAGARTKTRTRGGATFSS